MPLNPETLLPMILDGMDRGPCACGARPHGDRQEQAGPVRCLTRPAERGNNLTRITCRLRCQVCLQEHEASQFVTTSSGVDAEASLGILARSAARRGRVAEALKEKCVLPEVEARR